MAIAFQTLVPRSARRVRVVFSNTLAAGAFSPTWYTFESLDDFGAAPSVSAAFVVADSPNVVELSLSLDLVGGAGYRLNVAAGVPAADASTAPSATFDFRVPLTPNRPTPRLGVDPLDVLYGVDLAYDGTDWIEDASGDLAAVSGQQNVIEAVTRRELSSGLAWDSSYGPKAREFVDGPAAGVLSLRSRLLSQARADARVKQARVTLLDADSQRTGQALFEVELRLIGDVSVKTPLTIPV